MRSQPRLHGGKQRTLVGEQKPDSVVGTLTKTRVYSVYTIAGQDGVYVGCTSSPESRWRDHCAMAGGGVSSARPLYRSMQKRGRAAFTFAIVAQSTDKAWARAFERELMVRLRRDGVPIFNLNMGGDVGRRCASKPALDRLGTPSLAWRYESVGGVPAPTVGDVLHAHPIMLEPVAGPRPRRAPKPHWIRRQQYSRPAVDPLDLLLFGKPMREVCAVSAAMTQLLQQLRAGRYRLEADAPSSAVVGRHAKAVTPARVRPEALEARAKGALRGGRRCNALPDREPDSDRDSNQNAFRHASDVTAVRWRSVVERPFRVAPRATGRVATQ